MLKLQFSDQKWSKSVKKPSAFVSRMYSITMFATRGQCFADNQPQPGPLPPVEPRNLLRRCCHYLFTSAYYTDLCQLDLS